MGQEEVIAGRYAKALAEHAAESGEVERARRDLAFLAELLDPSPDGGASPELLHFLTAPGIDTADKIRTAFSIMDKLGVGEMTRDFLGVLIERNRVGLTPKIARAFADAAGDITGDRTAVVQTARPLTAEQSERLRRALSGVFGGDVRIVERVKPELLAGARVTVGDRLFDGSVLGRLEQLRNRLLTRGVMDAREPENDAEEAAAAQG